MSWHHEPDQEGNVYIIRLNATGLCKIGFSVDPQSRLYTIKTTNPSAYLVANTPALFRHEDGAIHMFQRGAGCNELAYINYVFDPMLPEILRAHVLFDFVDQLPGNWLAFLTSLVLGRKESYRGLRIGLHILDEILQDAILPKRRGAEKKDLQELCELKNYAFADAGLNPEHPIPEELRAQVDAMPLGMPPSWDCVWDLCRDLLLETATP